MENQPLDSIQQKALPNSTGVLVLGIASIVLCCCYGIFGIITSIVSLVLAHQAKKLYFDNPELYTETSYKNMQGGKICAIIGLCLSCLYFIYAIVMITFFLNGNIEGFMNEIIQEIQNH